MNLLIVYYYSIIRILNGNATSYWSCYALSLQIIFKLCKYHFVQYNISGNGPLTQYQILNCYICFIYIKTKIWKNVTCNTEIIWSKSKKKLNIKRQTAIICFELNKITRMILKTNTSKLDGIHNIGGIWKYIWQKTRLSDVDSQCTSLSRQVYHLVLF